MDHNDGRKERESFITMLGLISSSYVMILGMGANHNDRQQAVQEDTPPVSSLSYSVSCK